jgi:hypothetical protein
VELHMGLRAGLSQHLALQKSYVLLARFGFVAQNLKSL